MGPHTRPFQRLTLQFSSLFLLGLCACPLALATTPPAKRPVKPVTHAAAPARPAAGPSAAAFPYLQKGVDAYKSGQLDQALLAYKQGLALMGPEDPNLLVAYDGLAKIYIHKEAYQTALPYAQKVIPLLQKRHGATSTQVADGLYTLGMVKLRLNDTAGAESHFKQAVALYEAPANAQHFSILYPATVSNLGSMASDRHDYPTALALYQKALSIKRQHGDADYGILYENLGIAYQNQGQSEQAANYYQQALTAYEADSNTAAIKRVRFKLENIRPVASAGSQTTSGAANEGNTTAAAITTSTAPHYDGRYYEAAKKAYNVDKNYEIAAQQFQLALAQAVQYYPQEKRFIASLQSALGRSLYMTDEDKAAPPLEQALTYQAATMQPNDPELVGTHQVLGLLYAKKEDYEAALPHLQYVTTHASQDSSMTQGMLTTLADTLCHMGRFAEGKQVFEQAIAWQQQQPVPDEKRIKSIQYQLNLLDKMFANRSQALAEYMKYSVDGIRRWSDDTGSIQILLMSGQGLPDWNEADLALARRAFQEWQTVLGNRIRFEFTNNPDKSDVQLSWVEKPLRETDVDARLGVNKVTTLRGLFLSSDIVVALSEEQKPRTDRELYATLLHEIGHMLGLNHSTNLADIMAEEANYSLPAKGWPTLTPNDIHSALLLYQQKPAVTNPLGITLAEYRRFQDIAKEGLTELQRDNYRQAKRKLENAREFYSHDPYINFYYGMSAFANEDYETAKDMFENLTMPESASKVFSVDGQLGMAYVELGHKYNRWGRKNKAISNDYYDKGVQRLHVALLNPQLSSNMREVLIGKLREGESRQRPQPIYNIEMFGGPNMMGRF